LEALHPGELARIVNEAIDLFQDSELQGKYQRALSEADKVHQEAWNDVVTPHQDKLLELEESIRAIGQKHVDAFNAEANPLLEELETLRQAVEEGLDEVDVALPALPEAEVQRLGREPYFDSSREYMEQLGYYKGRNGGST